MKSGSTTSFSTCKGNWRLAHPFTKPCEEVICLERIMPMQNSAQGADVEPSMADIDRIGFGTAIWSRLTAAPSAE